MNGFMCGPKVYERRAGKKFWDMFKEFDKLPDKESYRIGGGCIANMKGIPINDKEYAEVKAMLDSFKPENLHKKVKRNVDAKRKICYNTAVKG